MDADAAAIVFGGAQHGLGHGGGGYGAVFGPAAAQQRAGQCQHSRT